MKKQKSSDAVNEETIVIFSACGLRSQLKKCRLALLMSTHARLGRDSPINKIGKDVIRLIAKNYITLSSCTSSTSQAVGKVHDYRKIDTFMAIVTNKISSPHPTSHFSNVTFVDSDLCEHVPFLFQTPLMYLHGFDAETLTFMFKVYEGVFNHQGRNHPFLKWIEKMEHVVNTTLLNSYPERSGVTFEPSVNTVGRSSHWLFVTGSLDCQVDIYSPQKTISQMCDLKTATKDFRILYSGRLAKLILSTDRMYDHDENNYLTRFVLARMMLY